MEEKLIAVDYVETISDFLLIFVINAERLLNERILKMLIDQFTEEQLAQIRRELREIQKLSKATLHEELFQKVDEVFDRESYHKECIFPYREVSEAISTLADYTLDNFVYKKHGRAKKQIGWYRSQNIPNNKEKEYREITEEIMDIIRKHKKEKKFSLKKPEGM